MRKLISPSGIALVLLCLFLPFVGVACETELGSADVEISGWDMVTSGRPSVHTTGSLSDPDASTQITQAADDNGVPVRPLMIVAVVALVAAAALDLALRKPAARAMAALGALLLATLAVVANQFVVMDDIADDLAGGTPSAQDLTDTAELVGTRVGFWLTLGLLVALLVHQFVELTRRPPTPPPWPQG